MSYDFNYEEWHSRDWAIDLDISIDDVPVADAVIYGLKLNRALTANGNFCVVDFDGDCFSIYGNGGGDNETAVNLICEMCGRGCVPWAFDKSNDNEQHVMTGAEWDAMLARLGMPTNDDEFIVLPW